MDQPGGVNQSETSINTTPPLQENQQPVSPIVNQAVQNPINPNTMSTPKPKHLVLKWIGAIIGIFVLFGVIVGSIAFVATSGPVKVANEQLDDIKQGNLQAAYDLFSTNAKAQYTFVEFQSLVSQYSLDNGVSLSFNGRQIANDRAQLDGKMTKNGVSRGVTYILTKEGDSWKIATIDIKAIK